MPFKAVVVSTGGGAVVRQQNWGYMQHGVVVWLRGEPELLARRALRDGIASRPMLAQGGGGAQEVGFFFRASPLRFRAASIPCQPMGDSACLAQLGGSGMHTTGGPGKASHLAAPVVLRGSPAQRNGL